MEARAMHHKTSILTFVLTLIFAGLLISAPFQVLAATGTVDIRVIHDDDSEEHLSDGGIDDGSSDLELGYESSSAQIVGIRFLNVSIPQGATITNAFIEFTTDETDSSTTNLTIWGEDQDNAARFTISAYDISSRTKTSASVSWPNVPAWGVVGETGVKQQTPPLTAIVQEIVNRTGWSGGAMVFLITGTGERTAESYDGSSSQAPLLHVEYTTESAGGGGGESGIMISASTDDAREAPCTGCDNGEDAIYVRLYRTMLRIPDDTDEPIGLRFQNVDIPRGTIITNAYLEFTAYAGDSGAAEWVITGQATDNPVAFDDTFDNISARPRTGQSVTWTIPADAWVTGTKYQSPDISAIIQEIVGRAGWNAGNSLVLIIDSPAELYYRRVFSWDGAYASAADNGKEPKLVIEYGNETGGDEDSDGDGVLDSNDNCPMDWNPGQEDSDGNGMGDACDIGIPDSDGDSIDDLIDNCVDVPNPSQADADGDGIGDACDTAPYITIDNETLGTSCYEGEIANSIGFRLTNSGAATLDYTVSVTYNFGSGWLSLSPSTDSDSLGAAASKDYTVGFNSAALAPGTYDAKITITDPSGAAPNSPKEIIVSLTVFTLPADDAALASCGHVPVYVDNMVNPAILILLDVSGSMDSNVDVTEGDPPQTPSIKAIVQEIVSRSGWQSGNAMVFLIEGSGNRMAQSFDESSGSAPLLHVDYNDGSGNKGIDLRVNQSSDDAEQDSAGSISLSANILDMMNNGGNKAVGLRFRSVSIPQGATINAAYLEFTTAATASTATTLKIYGQDYDNPPTFATSLNNISNRIKTTAYATWTPEAWGGITQQWRVTVGKDVISELVKDRSISWGFGSWCEKYEWKDPITLDNTLVFAGTKPNTDAHQFKLQRAISEQTAISNTPFIESMIAAKKYFAGQKSEWNYNRRSSDGIDNDGDGKTDCADYDEDELYDIDAARPSVTFSGAETGDVYNQLICQPKFLIEITDGAGDDPGSDWVALHPNYSTGTLEEQTARATAELADAGITSIGVGFDLSPSSAGMLFELSRVANERGHADPNDNLYALHPEINGVGKPFFAYNKQELINALKSIADSVKGAVFHGSAPAPSTSADLGQTLVVAHFDPSRWTGELEALVKIDPDLGWTSNNMTTAWSAGALMPFDPAERNVWTINPASPYDVVRYTDATLTGDNWLCKPIGDIINSTPVVVGTPPFFYAFDNYGAFKYNIIAGQYRPAIIYVGSNDGSLHAFALNDYTPVSGDPVAAGEELWAFVPKSLHEKLKLAGSDASGTYDMCSDSYCHQYLLDGSPKVADVSVDFDLSGTIEADEWRTILVTGLRQGGQAYFALDVTSGQDFDVANADPAVHLWELEDYPYLGESWSEPSISRVLDTSVSPAKTMWAAYFGSGYSPTNQSAKQGYLYGVEAYDGSNLWKSGFSTTKRVNLHSMDTMKTGYLNFDSETTGFVAGDLVTATSGGTARVVSVTIKTATTGTLLLENIQGVFANDDNLKVAGTSHAKVDGVLGNIYTGDAVSSPLVVDLEGDYTGDRIYAGNLYGNMYRVDNIGKDQTPTPSTLFTFDHTNTDTNPVRAKADFAYADYYDPTVWVYWGTGRYEDQTDKTTNASQYFFGVKDWKVVPADKSLPYRLGDLVTHKAKFVTPTEGPYAGTTYRVIEGFNPKATPEPWAIELFAKQGDWGWSGPMPVGSERVLTKPLVLGGVVFFNTFIPDQNVCAGNGESWLFAVDFETGLIPDYPVWDINGDGLYNENDMIKIGVDGEGNDILVPPNGLFIGRGQASHLVFHDGYLFYTTTGSGDEDNPGGGPGGVPPNPKFFGVKLRSWKQN